MTIENDYNNLDKQSKDRVLIFIISQASLIILGLLLGIALVVFAADNITLIITKRILLVVMMFLCVAIYHKSIGSFNKY